MGLRLKFNLVLLAVFLAGFVIVGVVADSYVEKQARDEAARAARIALDAASFSTIDPKIASALGSRVAELKMKDFPVADARAGLELDLIFRLQVSKIGEVGGEVTEGNSLIYFVARNLRAVPEQGQPERIRLVTVNLDLPLVAAKNSLYVFMISLGTVFFAVFFGLNFMLDRMIIRPVAGMSEMANAISVGDFSIPEFSVDSSDEIGVLSAAFNRMRRSTEEAIRLLKG
ncbi:MAG: HAMP domain-containing protein [Candidatus Nitrotoga sp.]